MCQTALTIMPSPHVLPTLLTRRNSFPSINSSRGEPIVEFGSLTPIRNWNCSNVASLADQINNGPMLFRVAGGDPISTPRLHAVSTRTRAAMLVMLGRVFLSVVDDRVLAKERGPAPRSANCRGVTPSFFTPLTRRIPAAESALRRPQSAASYASRRTAPRRRLTVPGAS